MSQLPKNFQPIQNSEGALHVDEKPLQVRLDNSPDMDKKISNAVLAHIVPEGSLQACVGNALPQHVISIKHSQQEVDLIRMKAQTLLSLHGIEFKSIAEALNSLQEASIQTAVDLDTRISTLCLTLALPNVTVKIQGSFKRNPESRVHSIPISNSFQLFIEPLANKSD